MAKPQFGYDITSRDKSGPALKSATGGLSKLNGAVDKISGVMSGAFAGAVGVIAVKAIGKLVEGVGASIDAFAQQEAAIKRLEGAMRLNPALNGEAGRRIQQFTAEFQKLTGIGDEVTLAFAGMLGTMGRTEQQIIQVIEAAADLSAATGMSLESSVRNLNKTFGGLSGELGELIPEIKDFTREELEAGAAVEFIAEQFDGLSESMRDTTTGSMRAFKSAWGDLMEAMGAGFEKIIRPIRDGLTAMFEDITKFLRIAGIVPEAPAAQGVSGAQAPRASGPTTGDMTREYGEMFRERQQWIIERYRVLGREAVNVAEENSKAAMKIWETMYDKGLREGDEVFDIVMSHIEKYIMTQEEAAEYAGRAWEIQVRNGEKYLTLLKEVNDEEERRRIEWAKTQFTEGPPGAAGAKPAPEPTPWEGFVARLNAADAALGQLGATAQLTGVGVALLNSYFNSLMSVIGPAVNNVLAPFFGIMRVMAETLGHILKPVIDILAASASVLADAFIWFYNTVLRPIAQAVTFIFTLLYDVVAGIANGIIKLLNKIPGVRIQELAITDPMDAARAIPEINRESLYESGMSDLPEYGTGGASYSGNQITINITNNIGVVKDSPEELARWMWDMFNDQLELNAIVA